MTLNSFTLFLLMFGCLVIFFISIIYIVNYILLDFVERETIANRNRRRNNRIIPIETIVRLTQLRQMDEQRYVMNNHTDVMSELKNKIIVINPDDSMSLGIEN
jgi:ABC-type bacteriocin/lantibiotic exporter with double-glycine peptidase domain